MNCLPHFNQPDGFLKVGLFPVISWLSVKRLVHFWWCGQWVWRLITGWMSKSSSYVLSSRANTTNFLIRCCSERNVLFLIMNLTDCAQPIIKLKNCPRATEGTWRCLHNKEIFLPAEPQLCRSYNVLDSSSLRADFYLLSMRNRHLVSFAGYFSWIYHSFWCFITMC